MNFSVSLVFVCYMLTLLCGNVANADPTLIEMRKNFLQAEQYIYQGQDNNYYTLANSLKNYPLYPYLQFQWLKNHLDNNEAVQNFLSSNEQSRYARLLRQKWLVQLGKNQQWASFISNYRNTEDPELLCYFAKAQYQNGQTQSALDLARQLWLSGKNLPSNCETVFTVLKAAPIFTNYLIWQRFYAALQLDNMTLVNSLADIMSNDDQTIASLWIKLHQHPIEVLDNSDWKHNYPQAGLLYNHTINRLLDTDPINAANNWETEKTNYTIPANLIADTEKRLALALAIKQDSRAFSKLIKLSNKDANSREWAVRTALTQQNWAEVRIGLTDLTEEEKQQDKWQYWLARSLTESGQHSEAQAIYQSLAKNRSFYGFLAAEHLQQNINLSNHPLEVSDSEIQALAAKPEFQVASELLAIARPQEAKNQWWHATSGLDQQGLTIAAKLAQQWQCPALAIFTIAKANQWDDLELRFPLHYMSIIQTIANDQHVDPAIIFGLIRQESAFDDYADSPAGAKGLMQLMPKTAQQIAQSFNDNWNGETSLFKSNINIKYGSSYYQKLLQQFDGNYLLATAAYNAGPNRVKRWLPERKSMPGDIWIEHIPYKETRNYVGQVLFYTLIYQQRLQRNSLKIADLITEVAAN